jgi:hypothetical protein
MELKMKKTKRAVTGSALTGMLLSLACAGFVFVGASSFLPRHADLATIAICPDLTAKSLNASKVISQDVHGARSVERPCANQLVLKAPGGNVSYAYDPVHRTLLRASGGNTERLLTGVDSISFSLLRPAPHGPYGALVPATASNTRAVACHWSRSWKVAGAKLDSEDFRMAAIVLRNR